MIINKNIIKFFALSICILSLAFAVSGQRRKTTTKTQPKPKVVTTDATAKTEIKSSAEKVSIQIKNSTKFLYLLGSVANGIEAIDKEIKAGKVSREIQDKNTQFKRDVMQSLRNLRAGLVQLEVDFRVKSELKPYLPQIQGISDMSARAEDLANAGQFTESGKTLLLVVEKLADTLAALP